ncbi:MAG: DUF433 domain-containing protein [Chloroflexota bacterium]
MREFERIRIEKGQAYIRDTGITVSEIVKKVIYQQSSSMLLVEYPTLDANDVEEAMAYAVSDVIETIAIWRNEGLTPLSLIDGYSELLLHDSQYTQEQKQQFNSTIYRSARHAVARWWNFTEWVYKTYRLDSEHYQAFLIDAIVQDVLRELPRYDPSAKVKWDVTTNLPAVRADLHLTTAIINLLTDRTSLFLKIDSSFEITSKNADFVNFKIVRQFEYVNHRESIDIDKYAWRSGPLSLARLIIHEHDSELKFTFSSEQAIFEFDLPIWHENT